MTLNVASLALCDSYYYFGSAAVDDGLCFSVTLATMSAVGKKSSRNDAMLARENGFFSVFEASINIDNKCDM